MKNSSLTTKLITAFFALTVLAYFGVQAWRYFTVPEVATAVYSYRAERVLALSGFLVRDELVIDCSEPLVELTRAEGERVAKGKRVATVYQSAEALEAERQAAALRVQLEQLQYAKAAARDATAALRLDSEIEDGIIALRATLAAGNYAAASNAVTALETTVLRREYAYRGSTDLGERVEALETELALLTRSVGSGARTVAAPAAGTYSAVVDGYENVLTPDALSGMTPSALAQVQPEPVSSTVGKLILSDVWYYAAAIPEADAAGIAVGDSFELSVSGADVPLPVVVDALGKAENGERVLVLRGREHLSAITMLRGQSAELILESCTGLRVPKNALRIGDDQRLGVYCRIGRQAWFKPVELLYQGEDYCLVVPGEINATRESDYIFYTLRVGDEAIVSAAELYNGKVLEQS